jgi:hypothetical protein
MVNEQSCFLLGSKIKIASFSAMFPDVSVVSE